LLADLSYGEKIRWRNLHAASVAFDLQLTLTHSVKPFDDVMPPKERKRYDNMVYHWNFLRLWQDTD
jgi:hypothetical protein